MRQLRSDQLNSGKLRIFYLLSKQLLSLKKSHVLHHIIFFTACAKNVLQHERKRWTLTRLANNTFNNAHPERLTRCWRVISAHRHTIVKQIQLMLNR